MRYAFTIFILLLAAACIAQPPLEIYLQLPLGMPKTRADSLVNKKWRVQEVYDTGPYCTYFIGEGYDKKVTPGSFRLLLFYLNDCVACKELRLSAQPQNARLLLDSVRLRLEKIYGKPSAQAEVQLPQPAGKTMSYSWETGKQAFNEVNQVSLSHFKFDRPDHTVIIISNNDAYRQFRQTQKRGPAWPMR
jgi:hypothetical protein